MTERKKRITRSAEVIDRIIEAVGEGTPLAEVLREDWAPHHSSWYQWLNDDPELDRRFQRAREMGHDIIAASARRVARGEDGSSNDVKRDRLIVDTDLKLLEKWDRRYRPAQILSGDPDAPLIPPVTVSPNELAGSLIEILRVARLRKERAERDGLTAPFTPEQQEFLQRVFPSPVLRLFGPNDASDLA